ncbi:MAG: DivIVA domain-containing protein [Oscillospiraceae bacterium]|nr:DivIVA domain-containing protein [Oscillospiraceae bacterium]
MITAQDIREKGFERVRLNGYDMAAVDEFLEELADDVAATQKENAVLKSKMKVLVDKIEEYRANEEALNGAILSAQKLAVQIESEARQRAAATVADAEKQAQDTIGSIAARADAEEKRLANAKASCAKFFESAKELFGTQLDQLDAIRTGMGVEAPKPAADVDETVRAIENSAARFQADAGADRVRKFENTQPFTL